MGDFFGEDASHLAPVYYAVGERGVGAAGGAQKVPKVIRHADVLDQSLFDVETRPCGPAQQEGLYEGSVRDAGVRSADAGEEPG